ncbi:hypothetical protein MRQ36_18505 [Micromonospora sp. R77]|uniref:hypothetical protein n=1 Tax=Micromonospora sp. R77 TaxID=2925836 RepID=UPI001F60EDCC|nr:hypothetical protein [Micromonospora sp. R77]MCI4064482.1 hypothetical protein [Micromonospora sp. R77]
MRERAARHADPGPPTTDHRQDNGQFWPVPLGGRALEMRLDVRFSPNADAA